jgi:hypothetical protein
MRMGFVSQVGVAALLAMSLAACGGTEPARPVAGTAMLEGDAALIASVQTISDTIGGCAKPGDATVESKVVSLENSAIVMLACSQSAYSYTHRLFAIKAGAKPELLALPDFDADGWYGADQASMAELDAGTGVLTTLRKGDDKGTCGSEGRYQWDGKRFIMQEARWQPCTKNSDSKGPPFPTIWPAQVSSEVDPNGATPAP